MHHRFETKQLTCGSNFKLNEVIKPFSVRNTHTQTHIYILLEIT